MRDRRRTPAERHQRKHDDRNGASTKPDSRGLVQNIMTDEPMNSMMLRSAIETDAPTALLICVVSAVSRVMTSPVWAVSKKAGDSSVRCANTDARKVGDDTLADDRDEVVARGARDGEHAGHQDHHGEISIDQPDAFRRETEVDHPAYRKRNDQRCHRGDEERDQRRRVRPR